MATLWHSTDRDHWASVELRRGARLAPGRIETLEGGARPARPPEPEWPALVYAPEETQGARDWVLVASRDAAVRVNEAPLGTLIRVLTDRDAIRLAGSEAIYFSTERLARIEPFAGPEPVFCPRCRLEIATGAAAVCCPACGVWHHERVPDGPNCWTYAPTCALCDQPTSLDSAEWRWTPECL